MDKQTLLNRLSDIEWDDFEVKEAARELPKTVWETVSAFANTAGGWIVLGVSCKGKKFEITGVEQGERIEQDFTNVLRSRNKFNVLIAPKCKKYNIAGSTVLAFFIPASPQKPVYFNSLINTFIRSGSGDQRATESEINAMFRDQLFGAMSVKPVERTGHKDLNMTTYRRYRDYMARFNPALSYNALPDSEFLEKMQITEGKHLTYGGLLFMGNNIVINKIFPDFRVDLLEIPGRSYAEAATRYTFRLEEQENLWEYYFAIIERLKRHVDMPFKMNELGIAVEDSPQFDALREALVNMLMHTDYFSPAKPRVRIFSNRVEFENPGAFPRTIETFLRKDISIPRNPVLAKLFRSAKLAENAGYGFDKMLAWEKSTQTKVIFENSIDVAQVSFVFFPEDFEDGQKKDEQENVQDTGGKKQKNYDINEYESVINVVREDQVPYGKRAENEQKNNSISNCDSISSVPKYVNSEQKTSRKRAENEQKNNYVNSCNSISNAPKYVNNEQKTSRKRAENEQKNNYVNSCNSISNAPKYVNNEQKTSRKQAENKQKNNYVNSCNSISNAHKYINNEQKTSRKRAENEQKNDYVNNYDSTSSVPKYINNEQKTGRKRAESEQSDQDVENVILDMIRLNPKVSRAEISSRLGFITRGGVSYYMEKLKKTGMIKREGPDKGGIWIVFETDYNR